MLKDLQPAEATPDTDTDAPAPAAPPATAKAKEPAAEPPKTLEDVVIEEVGIDAMCGVY